MVVFLFVWFSLCLLCVIGMTTAEPVMKAVLGIAACCLISFVWLFK